MELRAGNLTMTYDRGFLRYIFLGQHEVLRMIYFALRDHNWDTMDGYLEDEVLRVDGRSFEIQYRWVSASDRFPFFWLVNINGTENSEVIFTIEGTAQADVRKNRAGFCILHSIKENAGGPCIIINQDGKKTDALFPRYISPHQPFFDITSMQWPLAQWGKATLHFSGDIFETEDQRNWSDDSYKTYCTPLRIPFPAWLKKDEKVRQQVRLHVDAFGDIPVNNSGAAYQLTPQPALRAKPRIGLGAPGDHYLLTHEELMTIRPLEFDHYRVEVDFSQVNWQQQLLLRIGEAIAMQLDLELVLFFTKQAKTQAEQMVGVLAQLPAEMRVDILLLHKDHKTTPGYLTEEVVPVLRKAGNHISLGAGTAIYFTELNRDRVNTDEVDFVSYSLNPQVHAFDDASMIENSFAQYDTVESALAYFNGLPVHVSPVTLKPRFNPNATSKEAAGTSRGLPESVDIRQLSLLGGAWTLNSLLQLASAGAFSVTYYEAVGWKGIMQGGQPPAAPDLFPVRQAMWYPLGHILQCFLQKKGTEWLPFISSHPLRVSGIGFRDGQVVWLLIANFSDQSIHVRIGYACTQYKIFIYDANNLADSYFDSNFLEKGLDQVAYSSGPVTTIKLGAHAIVYAKLLD